MSTYGKQISEIDFIEQLRQGDNGGFEILYDRYSAMLFGIILRVVNDNEDAENLLQDCFVKIWKNIASYDATKGRLATWMINVARNTAIDFTRSKVFSQRKRNQSIENGITSTPAISHSPIPTDTIGLRQIVNKLPSQHREIIEWMYFEGFTQQEISDNFEIPLGTVKTRARNALIELRRVFEIK